jgi:2-keto-4-pentenoate hydratase/2-oxohepta-3-ene-1,7-dioic acid hydratase in catechol pathway
MAAAVPVRLGVGESGQPWPGVAAAMRRTPLHAKVKESKVTPKRRSGAHNTNEEESMTQNRRTFLKTAALAGAAATASGTLAAPALAQRAAAPTSGPQQLPRGLTLATLRRPSGYGLGVRHDRGILDVAAAEQEFRENAPTTIDAVFKGSGDVNGLKRLLDKASASASAERFFVAAERAEFGPCVTNPEKIVCIGLNYRKHAAETGNPVPKQPILFNKFNTALNHHGGIINVAQEDAEKFDYEAELVIVIGRQARNVSEQDAGNYILGYATGNDFTARDLQSRSSQWMLGKTLDGSAPLGPWLVGADLADGDNVKIECRVNGEVRQSSNTSDMVFNTRQLVSYISRYMTLKAGDIIFTGTPEGVISGYPKDKQVWLKAGDKIVTSIEKLGDLAFTLTDGKTSTL